MNLGLIKTAGIVTKEIKYGGSSKIITIITRDLGKISAIANNARSGKSHMLAGLQLFAFSEFVVFKSKGKNGLYKLDEVTVCESFANIRMSLEKLAYASYFAEVINFVSNEESPDEELLRLMLNMLFVLDCDLQPFEKIKTVFEWRLAADLGYAPLIDEKCANHTEAAHGTPEMLSLSDGQVYCTSCAAQHGNTVRLSPSMLKTIDYICNSDSKKIFSFEAAEKNIEYLSRVSELYLEIQLEHKFGTLEYLKKVTALDKIGQSEDNNADKN